jgi:hypothetical protein
MGRIQEKQMKNPQIQYAFKWRMFFLNKKKLSDDDRSMNHHAMRAMKGNKKSFRILVQMLQYRGMEDYGN